MHGKQGAFRIYLDRKVLFHFSLVVTLKTPKTKLPLEHILEVLDQVDHAMNDSHNLYAHREEQCSTEQKKRMKK